LSLRNQKSRDVIKVLTKYYGFSLEETSGSHFQLKHPDGRRVTVPRHDKPLKPGTLKSIIIQAQGVLGIGLGVENIAVDIDKQIFDSKKIEYIRRKYSRLRADLQHVGTRSAKRKLRKLSGKERRFKKDVHHCITNQIISKAIISRENRDKLSKWTYGEMRTLLEYIPKSHTSVTTVTV
jgi:predicted RNA binding protein YcfA (HicA-like mRNA interferase family)